MDLINYQRSGYVLISQYFYSENPRLRKDLNNALQRNLNHPAITTLILLNEQELDFSTFQNSWKVQQYVLGKRLTFREAFLFASTELLGRTVILGENAHPLI